MPVESRTIIPTIAQDADTRADTLVHAASAALDAAGSHERRALRELALPVEHRLDERTLASLRRRLAAAAAPIERGVRLGAAQRLGAMQAVAAAERLLDDPVSLLADLFALAANEALVLSELLAIVRLEALAANLPPGASTGADRPSLLARLAGCPEPDIAEAASALLAAHNRQAPDVAPPLPVVMRDRLVWWTAALLRDRMAEDPRVDHALVEAAAEMIDATPDEVSPQSSAMRFAELVGARPDELPALLLEAIGDRQPVLFVALLAHASGLTFGAVRAMLTDAAGERLWLLLRAQDLDRATIARIGVALAEADPRRDLDRFVAALDVAMTVAPERAAAVFAGASLPPCYRAALADVRTLGATGASGR
ncbi:DUF2336 domain-containing protein [Sphingomonas bacterium]|uniref:DUF2336 domain-containing protein n=1 Tax=Sphingomonas bacterium TaxID=1895847 RepID=UPI001574F484|nr:DUF2336 domain-containing protein [Sphingomonas bacterium]